MTHSRQASAGDRRLWCGPNCTSVQVVKQYSGRRLSGVQRREGYGCMQAAEAMMQAAQVGLGVINTAA